MRPTLSRRALAAASCAALVANVAPPVPAHAFLDDVLPRGSRLSTLLEGSMRPKIKALPRRRLEQDFAVLLMRTSYSVADDLDFMPMNEFQRSMFLLRQNEWDEYRTALPVTQGDLSDPAYFDFMSFCQYATIADGMRNGRVIFEELIDANGTTVVVSRDASLPRSNALLPEAHAERVGERILAWIDDRFPNLAPRVPPPGAKAPPTAEALVDGLRALASVFEINEYMLTSSVEPLPDRAGVAWTLVAPANMWSAQVLKVRGDLANDFEAKAALAYLRRCGVPASCSTRFEQSTRIVHEIRWPQALVS